MTLIKAIIFSKNRAMQLEALLSSIKMYADFYDISVIYTYDSEPFYQGYEMLKKEYKDVCFYKETLFKANILDILQKDPYEYISFFSDDDIFFRPFQAPPLLPEDVLCYSPRLGLNTNHCFNFAKKQDYRGILQEEHLLWKWKEGEWDFGYPMSIDGHIFRRQQIEEMIKSIECNDPFELEDALTILVKSRKDNEKDIKPFLMAGKESVLVGIPHNKVMFNFPFPHAGGSFAMLNQLFLEGKRVRYLEMDFSDIRGAHQIIPFVVR